MGPGNLINTNVFNWKHIEENISKITLEWVDLGTALIDDKDSDEKSLEVLEAERPLADEKRQKVLLKRYNIPTLSSSIMTL